jgi:hypothetical protein
MKYHSGGNWNASTTLEIQAGQAVELRVRNVNVLGTTIHISEEGGESREGIIPPLTEVRYHFTRFADEPTTWKFRVDSDSDAFMVTWQAYSTWVPGDPPNPPNP